MLGGSDTPRTPARHRLRFFGVPRLWTAVKLLTALAAVGGLLFVGATFFFEPAGHGDGGGLADNAASRAIRNVFDRDDEVVDGVQAAHREFNAEIWGDGGDLIAACTRMEEALGGARDGDTYGAEQVDVLADATRRICDGDGSPLELHDLLDDVEERLRAA